MVISPISYQNYQSNNINFKGTNLVNVAQKQKKNLKVVFLGLAGLLGYKVIKDNNKDFQITSIQSGKEGVLIDYIDSNGKFNSEFFRQTEKEKMMNFLSENYGIELERKNTSIESENEAISIKEDNNGVSVYVGQRGEFIPTFCLAKKEAQQKQQSPMVTSMREQYIPQRTLKPQIPEAVEEESLTDVLWDEQQRLLELYAARIKKALTAYAAYDLKKVNKNVDGNHIIYEGQRTIAGKSVDITDKGDVVVKIALEYTPDLPENVIKMIDTMFKYGPQHKSRAREIARQVLKYNPYASLDEIGIAIKESFR